MTDSMTAGFPCLPVLAVLVVHQAVLVELHDGLHDSGVPSPTCHYSPVCPSSPCCRTTWWTPWRQGSLAYLSLQSWLSIKTVLKNQMMDSMTAVYLCLPILAVLVVLQDVVVETHDGLHDGGVPLPTCHYSPGCPSSRCCRTTWRTPWLRGSLAYLSLQSRVSIKSLL